jgi:hypothetical protein
VERAATHGAGIAGGAVAGAVAGAASGIAAGPLGSLVGAAAGAMTGAAMGAGGRGKEVDLTPHVQWWREHFAERRHDLPGGFEAYEPAFRYGTEQYLLSDRPRDFDEVQEELRLGWLDARGDSRMDWEAAQPAVRDAWERLHDPAAFERGRR